MPSWIWRVVSVETPDFSALSLSAFSRNPNSESFGCSAFGVLLPLVFFLDATW